MSHENNRVCLLVSYWIPINFKLSRTQLKKVLSYVSQRYKFEGVKFTRIDNVDLLEFTITDFVSYVAEMGNVYDKTFLEKYKDFLLHVEIRSNGLCIFKVLGIVDKRDISIFKDEYLGNIKAFWKIIKSLYHAHISDLFQSSGFQSNVYTQTVKLETMLNDMADNIINTIEDDFIEHQISLEARLNIFSKEIPVNEEERNKFYNEFIQDWSYVKKSIALPFYLESFKRLVLYNYDISHIHIDEVVDKLREYYTIMDGRFEIIHNSFLLAQVRHRNQDTQK